MGLKALKEYGLKFKDVKAVCKELNEAELTDPVEVKIGIKGDVMLSAFMDAIESIPKKRLSDIPDAVSTFYSELPQDCFDDDEPTVEDDTTVQESTDEITAPIADTDNEITSECPAFLTGCDDSEPECQECKNEMPEEYKACRKAVVKAMKKEANKKNKKNISKKNAGKRTRYGHMPGSMSGRIDDMVYDGTTKADMITILMSEFGREEKQATGKLNAHLKCLINKCAIEIKEKKDGTLKAKQKYAEGYDKNNTISAS